MRPSRRILRPALIAVLVLAVVAIAARAALGPAKSDAKTGKVTRQNLEQRVTIAGTVVSRRRTVVAAPYNGYVKQLFVKVGDKVKPGQPLVSIAQSLQTNEPVFPLRAPYEGTVMHVNKREGEYVKDTDAVDYVLRIDDLTQLYVQANAPEIDWARLKTGMEGAVKAAAVPAKTYKGKISELTLAPQPNQSGMSSGSGSGGEYPVRIEISDADPQLGPGMSVVVDITTSKKENVLTLRHEFVFRGTDGDYAILADGTRRKIEVGVQNDELVEIKSGLSENDKVRQIDFSDLPDTAAPAAP